MIGLTVRRAIKTRLITRTPAVQSYRGDTVTLSDGHRLQPDLVVFSTGFRYASEPLARLLDYDAEGRLVVRKCESTRTRGLYLLGFRFGRTLASPYLRRIARDAQYVAERIVSDRRGIDHNRLVPVWGLHRAGKPMKAIQVDAFGGVEALRLVEHPKPSPAEKKSFKTRCGERSELCGYHATRRHLPGRAQAARHPRI